MLKHFLIIIGIISLIFLMTNCWHRYYRNKDAMRSQDYDYQDYYYHDYYYPEYYYQDYYRGQNRRSAPTSYPVNDPGERQKKEMNKAIQGHENSAS